MQQLSIPQCDRTLDFAPHQIWPRPFPAMRWKGLLLTSFDRSEGPTVDLSSDGVSLSEALQACYPELGFAELARLELILADLEPESLTSFLAEYGMRFSDRLRASFRALLRTPREFQDFVDEKKMSARDLAPLLALGDGPELNSFFRQLSRSTLSKSQATQVLENGVELFLLGATAVLRLENETDQAYVTRLEKQRKPRSAASDDTLKTEVSSWPWPAQVQGSWQRFGDQAGLEIRIRATSPQDLSKKLERLETIREKWSCSN